MPRLGSLGSGGAKGFGFTALTGAAGPTVIGQSFGGGYYAGKISTAGNTVASHYLIVAPASVTGSYTWKVNTTGGDPTSLIDGPTNSTTMNNGNYPAAQYAKSLTTGGYTDWYLPARNELLTAFYFLRRSSSPNNRTSDGANVNAVSPQPYNTNFTTSSPGQTTAAAFQTGGSEDFQAAMYWSSSEYTTDTAQAWIIYFGYGYWGGRNKQSFSRNVRATRRVPV